MNRAFIGFLEEIGGLFLFYRSVIGTARHHRGSRGAVFAQIADICARSLPTVIFSGLFVGAILVIQFNLILTKYDAQALLGGLNTSATVRQVGPLIISFLLAGKVGAFTTAELGTMRVTEQIDAIRCLGANPIQEIILPRYLGIVISSFFLLAAGLVMSVFGGLLLGYLFSGINPEEYTRHIPTIVTRFSIFNGLFKCLAFALVLSSICTYKGYTTRGGAKGVGRAVVSTAVFTMVGIVVMDWFTSFLTDSLASAMGWV